MCSNCLDHRIPKLANRSSTAFPSLGNGCHPFSTRGHNLRDKRFVAVHRGGVLSQEHHRQLMTWSADCAEHVLHLFGEQTDDRLLEALKTARAWTRGEIPVGQAQKASVQSHAVARESENLAAIAVARAVGQAVATAHMADHSLGAALYALKAVKAVGKSIEAEKTWQNNQLPLEIKELVLSALQGGRFQTWYSI
jgi:hypothetical protein